MNAHDDAKMLSNKSKCTVLDEFHSDLGARMVAFAGYKMPLQYQKGIVKEHLHTRTAASLFDISHMGQIVIRPKSGTLADAALALEKIVPVDVVSLPAGRQMYAFFTNDNGGIEDDLMLSNRGDHYLLVVNAACKERDEALLRANLADTCNVENPDRALIAIQGPRAGSVLAQLAPACECMRFLDIHDVEISGADCIVSRSGYTGEDGFEISIPPEITPQIARALLSHADVEPAGLGARDSLRLEAGLPLYGSDLDRETTPVEAGLGWAISMARRRRGDREGGFPGACTILGQIENGPTRRRAGMLPIGRQPVRSGTLLFVTAESTDSIGAVTSGGFGPSVNRPISMGYLPSEFANPGRQLFADVRNRRVPVIIAELPFVEHRYKRRTTAQP